MTMLAVASSGISTIFLSVPTVSIRRTASARRPVRLVDSTEPIFTPAMRTSSPTLSSFRSEKPAVMV